MAGVPTGFAELDELTNGLHAGQMVIVAARPAVGKALALDTPLPTPTGWTTMGDVEVGDLLLGADGKPTRVVAATEVLARPTVLPRRVLRRYDDRRRCPAPVGDLDAGQQASRVRARARLVEARARVGVESAASRAGRGRAASLGQSNGHDGRDRAERARRGRSAQPRCRHGEPVGAARGAARRCALTHGAAALAGRGADLVRGDISPECLRSSEAHGEPCWPACWTPTGPSQPVDVFRSHVTSERLADRCFRADRQSRISMSPDDERGEWPTTEELD